MRYPLTNAQRWVWAGQQLLPDSPMNGMAFLITTPPQTDRQHLVAAIEHMVDCCDALHLQLSSDGAPAQVFKKEPFSLAVNTDKAVGDLRGEARAQPLQRLESTVFRPGGKLYDTCLYQTADGSWAWYFNQHHLITDGWAMALQVRYVFDCYEALRRGEGLPQVPFKPYTDYLNDPPAVTGRAEYWDGKAASLPVPPKLYGADNPERTDGAVRNTVSLGPKRAAALDALIQEPEVRNWSPDLAKYTVFATALYVYLYRISGQRELTIGTPAHNRISRADKQTPGLYMELFPQNVTIEEGETFSSLLQKVKSETMDFLRHAKPGTSTHASSRSFNVVLNYINQSFVSPQGTTIGVEWLHSGHTEPGHHLSVQVYDFEGMGVPKVSFDLNLSVLDRAFIREPARQFLAVFDELLSNLGSYVNQPGTRARAHTATFSKPGQRYPTDHTFVDLFYAAAAANADHPAVISEAGQLTYRELDVRSNQLAHHLLALGVSPEMPVAICLDRSLEMMVGLLGILKAGGAYCPIDPDFPAARIDYLLADTGAQIVLTTTARQGVFADERGRTIVVLERDWPEVSLQPVTEPGRRPLPTELMYILHTSGSTGRPKGVMNQHDGVVHRLLWAHDTFITAPAEEVFLQKTTFCFDVSVGELFWPLSQGMTLAMARPGGHKDDRYLREAIEDYGVTTMHFVPSMLEIFLEQAVGMPSLRRIICNGEALKPHQVVGVRTKLPHVELHNVYGPTEAAINVTHWPVPVDWDGGRVPIGKPLPDLPLYVLNEGYAHCPVGVPGELYLGGVQVARGYFGKPELTAAAFQDRVLYAGEPSERVYKTGDLVRWLPDGNIEFLGRIDGQVKIRGYRIELGEIAARLLELPSVRRAQVLAAGEGQGAYLTAYVVAIADFTTEAAKNFLARHLPEYMVPTHIVTIDEMPLNGSGKIDRRALAALSVAEPVAETVAPETEFEEMIQAIWREVLGLDNIGVTSSFHDLGGHSLTAIRLINRVNETFTLELTANTIFRFPTIRGLAGHIEAVIVQLMAETDDE